MCLLLCGCVTKNTLVPVTSLPVRDEGCSCCSPLHVVAQNLAPGATLLVSARPRPQRGPYVTVGLALAPEVTASFLTPTSFLTPEIIVWSAGSEKHAYPIAEVSSGAEGFRVPHITYPATSLLVGTSRMAQLSPPYGPTETFFAGVAVDEDMGAPLFVAAPGIRVGNATFTPEPIQFKAASESVGCVQ
jgi:hypothetical protein